MLAEEWSAFTRECRMPGGAPSGRARKVSFFEVKTQNDSRSQRNSRSCAISTESGTLKEYPYGFNSRFEGKPGTNPEELIGAAHAGCFAKALWLIFGEEKLTAEQMDAKAKVTLDKVDDGSSITSVHLTLRAKISGIDQTRFVELANKAKSGCPVSKLIKSAITLDAALIQ